MANDKRPWSSTFILPTPVIDADPDDVRPLMVDESAEGAGDGDDLLASHVNTLRNESLAAQTEIVTLKATAGILTTKGDLHGYDTANARIPVGSNGQVLVADDTESLGVKWDALSQAAQGGTITVTDGVYTADMDIDSTTEKVVWPQDQTSLPFTTVVAGLHEFTIVIPLFASSSSSAEFKAVFDEGTGDEQSFGYNQGGLVQEDWTVRVTASYAEFVFKGESQFSAGAHTVEIYGRAITGAGTSARIVAHASLRGPIMWIRPSSVGGTIEDTKQPQGEWKTTSTLDFYARSGEPGTVRKTLQDGKQRYYTGTLTWNIANGVADLGYDEAASQGNSKHLYFYLVPNSGDDDLISIRASDNAPSTGPTGYTEFECVWSTYIDGSGNLIELRQLGNVFKFLAPVLASAEGAGVVVKNSVALNGQTPATAVEALVIAEIENTGAAGNTQVNTMNLYITGEASAFRTQYITGPSRKHRETVWIPVSGATNTVDYESSGADINDNNVYVQGWIDGWVEP